ncbi:RDD family protein [Rickettsia endosymbiont of Cantharis rufa]|uniref:RDD family protein n=1 Tax=Rickettsia endosymbiont of Cantharis rufa TaxID=3066248 RepID=UPI00397C2231
MIFRRFFAILIDKLLLTIISTILFIFIRFLSNSDAIWLFTSFIIAAFYFYYLDSSKTQGTIGKRILGIKIVNIYDGNAIDGTTAFFRFIACFLINITIIGLMVSIIFMLFNEDEKMLHNIFFSTKVVKR